MDTKSALRLETSENPRPNTTTEIELIDICIIFCGNQT
jgi:hypothetical protein